MSDRQIKSFFKMFYNIGTFNLHLLKKGGYMQKFLLGLVLTIGSAGAQASLGIHSGCSDQTFAYNRMNISESASQIHFNLSGSTVFNLTTDWEVPSETSSFGIDKSKCRFSDDKLLLHCSSQEIIVARTMISFGEDQVKTRWVTVRNLNIEIRYVESVGPSGFELVTRYKVEDSGKYTSNAVLFYGDRELGCTTL